MVSIEQWYNYGTSGTIIKAQVPLLFSHLNITNSHKLQKNSFYPRLDHAAISNPHDSALIHRTVFAFRLLLFIFELILK